ncbi:MAG: HAMP domain-containing histidine kinase [Eubacterium sp.]|nr:HAMP domain-containing histidine kinase [Eubacterium sp.]
MNTAAIKQLRKKFVLIAMLSLFLAMLFIGLMINVANYNTTKIMLKQVMTHIIENDGELNEEEVHYEHSFKRGTGILDAFTPHYGRYQFYSCIFDKEKNLIKGINEIEYKEIDDSTYQQYAVNALEEEKSFVRYGTHYLMKGKTSDGNDIVVILDATNEITIIARLFYWTVVICFIGLLITFILVWIFSKKLIQPEIENAKRQKQFITNASHELKTPLAVIRANVEMEEIMNGETELSKSTIKQIDHMNGLIQNLVMIAKADEKEDKRVMTKENVSILVMESVEPFKTVAKQEHLSMFVEVEEDVVALVDGSKIRQLTTILVDNAIKYCDDEGVVRVKLTSIKKGKGMILRISNTYAEGESVDYRRFFDRFYRQDKAHNIDRGGYGIGLSIAESICKQHLGSIKVEWSSGEISFICKIL